MFYLQDQICVSMVDPEADVKLVKLGVEKNSLGSEVTLNYTAAYLSVVPSGPSQ